MLGIRNPWSSTAPGRKTMRVRRFAPPVEKPMKHEAHICYTDVVRDPWFGPTELL